jgi:hypothetical protein
MSDKCIKPMDPSPDPFGMGVQLPEGLLTLDDEKLLKKYAANAVLCVELGTHKGRGAALMGCFAEKVVTIDNYPDGHPEISLATSQENLKGFPNVEARKGISWESAESFPYQSIDVLFIDADHSLLAVLKDFRAFYKKVRPGGVFIFHDYRHMDASVGSERDVKGAVRQILNEEQVFDIEEFGWCKVLRKPPRRPEDEYVLNEAPIALKELVNRAVFLGPDCIRYDIIVRYIGVKSYARTEVMHPIYEKLERLRIMFLSRDPRAYYDPERFPKTIRSIRDSGFNVKDPIIVGNNFYIIEGAHRVAACMYFDVGTLHFVQWDRKGIPASYPWFEDNFSASELKIINETKGELYERYRQT